MTDTPTLGQPAPEPARLTLAPDAGLRDMARPWINEAVQKHGGGENVRWEMVVNLVPTPQGQPATQVGVFFFMPGSNLNEIITLAASIDNPLTFCREHADSMVGGILAHMREQRSQILAQATAGLRL